MERTPHLWPELEFIRDDGPVEDLRPAELTSWDAIVFELEDEEQPIETSR